VSAASSSGREVEFFECHFISFRCPGAPVTARKAAGKNRASPMRRPVPRNPEWRESGAERHRKRNPPSEKTLQARAMSRNRVDRLQSHRR
jgi:hypothetical protein